MVDTRRTPAQPLSTVHTHTWAINCPSYIIFYGETLIQCVQPHHGRVREVLRALRGIEAHRRVKVVPANFIGRWANSGSQTAILSSCLFKEKCPIIPRWNFSHVFPSSSDCECLCKLRFLLKWLGLKGWGSTLFISYYPYSSYAYF